jgi:hypothetical protein
MKDFTKKIAKIADISKQGLSVKNVIDDLVQLSLNILIDGIDYRTGKTIFQSQFNNGGNWCEEWFLQPLDKYRKDLEAWELLKELTDDYFNLVKKYEPFLDHFAIDYGSTSLNKLLGQFLTPPKVADCAGILNPSITAGQHIVVGDMCGSGGGAMILGLLRNLYTSHPKLMDMVHVVGIDKDPKMCLMTTLQLIAPMVIHNINLGSIEVSCKDCIREYSINRVCFYAFSDKTNFEEMIKQVESKPKSDFDVFKYMREGANSKKKTKKEKVSS